MGGAGAPELTAPCWRHVAAAARHTWYLLRMGSHDSTGPQNYMQVALDGNARATPHPLEATKFAVEVVSGGCIIREVGKLVRHVSKRGVIREGGRAETPPNHRAIRERVGYGQLEILHGRRVALYRMADLRTRWDVDLHARDSHLQFSKGRREDSDVEGDWQDARSFVTLADEQGRAPDGFEPGTDANVDHWELVPVALAHAGERFVFQKCPQVEAAP
jgi:hypothetical protein